MIWEEFSNLFCAKSLLSSFCLNDSSSLLIRISSTKKVDCKEWKDILEDQDIIVKKLGGNALFECIGKGATEINQITRFFNKVDFNNIAGVESVFAEIAKYIVNLRNVVMGYLK